MSENNNGHKRDTDAAVSRRQLLRSGAVAVTGVGTLTAPTSASSDSVETFRLEKSTWTLDLDRYRRLEGVTARETSDVYVVRVDKEVLPDPTPEERRKLSRQAEELSSEINILSPSEFTTDASKTVNLGSDKRLYSANTGNAEKNRGGAVVAIESGADYNTIINKATSTVLVGPAGVGGATYKSMIGTKFDVSGSGSETATVSGNGTYHGQITTVGGSEAGVEFYFGVKNLDTGVKQEQKIGGQGWGIVGFWDFSDSYNRGVTVDLRGGDTYVAYTRIKCNVGIATLGEAAADAGPFDQDDGSPPHGAKLNETMIRF